MQVAEWYDLVVFTASMEVYGDAIADLLDKNRGMFLRRLFRQANRVALITFCFD